MTRVPESQVPSNRLPGDQGLDLQGIVLDSLPNARYLCRTADGREVICHVGGDMRMKVVRVLPGEGVVMELSPLDPSKGRIVGKTGSSEAESSKSGKLNAGTSSDFKSGDRT